MYTIRKTSAVRADYKEIENKQDGATVYLYGAIGGWFGIDHLEWIKDFNAIDDKTIHLRIDSDGGDIFAARAIKTAIMQHKSKIIAHIDGMAASAASFLAMGANEIEIVDGGFLMIHNASSLLDILGFFNADDLDELIADLVKERDLHDKINESIASDYVKRSGADLKDVLQWMNNETWFTAKEALENNLVDRIYDGEPIEGKYDLSFFNNVPDELKRRSKTKNEEEPEYNDKRKAEKALRSAGFSRNDALKIVAKGFQDESESQIELVDQDVGDPQNDSKAPQSDSDNAKTEEDPKPKEAKDEIKDGSAEDLIMRAKIMAATT